ncbi:hypothetical protein Salat_2075800 [Sesamum alatum]|uniref:Uncharacterized protein n=1 Tax=Sesamum alatum TaxID=300844 RepID=A0AAE1Y070_9LAMI|nr:hypothetical protein Salat_2075800 [Sesamum alatum]
MRDAVCGLERIWAVGCGYFPRFVDVGRDSWATGWYPEPSFLGLDIMADGTCLKELQELTKKHDVQLMTKKSLREANENKVQTQLEDMHNSYMELLAGQKMIQQQLQGMMEQMQSQNKSKSILALLREGLSPFSERTSSSYQPPAPIFELMNPMPYNHLSNWARVEFPRFNDDQKVYLASVHLDDKAELWFQGLIEGKGVPT